MTYCGHYRGAAGAWPCTVLGKGEQVENISLRATRLVRSALVAYEQGADAGQLSEYLEEIERILLQGGDDGDVGAEDDPAGSTDPETPPPISGA